MNMKPRLLLLAVSIATLFAGPVQASEQEDMEIVRQTTINLINALVEKGVLTQESATAMIQQAEKTARKKVADTQAAQSAQGKTVRVPYVPESVKREIREQVKQEVVAQAKAERWGDVNAVPEWVNRIQWEGDLRLRYQNDLYPEGNATPAQIDNYYGLTSGTTGNTTVNRDRWRARARLGLTARISDMFSGGVRITTGDSGPLSTSQTLGNTSNKYSLYLDQAYLRMEPTQWLNLMGGRIPNPWFSTNLVWHNDLTFEGAAANARYRFDELRSIYLTGGAFPLQDIAPSTTNKAKSKWLTGMQAGVDWGAMSGSRARLGIALYDYKNVEGFPDTGAGLLDFDATKPQYRQRGNTMFLDPYSNNAKLASKFRELNLTAQVDLAYLDPVHVILTGDFVRNIGYNQSEIAQRTGYLIDRRTKGYQWQLQVGQAKIAEEGDWQVFGGYRYLERDAVLDAFTDSDFHLGGTDTKGFFLGASYGIEKNAWLSMRWLSANQLAGPPLAIDTLQVDLNAKF